MWGLKMHGLNKALLGKEAYLSHREMASTHFQNIVNTACTVSDFEWVNKFVEEYAPFLPAKIRAENVSLVQAAIAFEGKDFRKVIALTEKPQFKDEIHLLRMRVYQLRAMYELDLDCTNVFNTYYTYLVRHRKPVAKYKESAIAFMGVFNMLTQKKVTRKTLIEAIETNPQIFARKWLKDKAHTYRSTVYRGKET